MSMAGWYFKSSFPCPKRSVLWSSNALVINFNKERLTNAFKAQQRKLRGHVKPVTKSINKATGKVGYSGNRALKQTQILSQLLPLEARMIDAA